MEKDSVQKELFEFDAPKKQPNRFGQLFQKTDFAISLSAEKLVFVLIGIVMLLVISFALGVEKGKRVCGRNTEIPVQTSAQRASPDTPAQKAVQAKTVSAVTNMTPKEKTRAGTVKAAQDPVRAQNLADKNKPYLIVAAAFLKEASAAKEASRLKGSGLEAFVYYSEPYYLVCVGSFANKDSAQKMLNKVRQIYSDAYVRLR